MLKNLKNFNLSEIEEKVLNFWETNKIFEKSLDLRRPKSGKPKFFRFFEGPPTANGRPGTHHIISRSFKDIVLRYKTMRGYFALRRAGWDTHGLPVEIGVEKELGIKNKSEIEKFGIAEFNSRAKMSIWKYKNEWEKFTKRIGFWLDLENPYITYENSYIETLWWIFKEISKRGLLKKLHKIVPWCPRCQTPLSNNELGQPDVYKKVKDPSVYVKFPIKSKEYFLVWTTTPWTLPSNVAIAVNPKLIYTKFKIGNEFFWAYNPPPQVADKSGAYPEINAVEKIAGSKLVGKKYKAPYGDKLKFWKQKPKKIYEIVAGDFVKTEEGTGLVHIAPAFGEEDLALIKKTNPALEIPITIDDRGIVKKGIPGAGKFIKEADKDIIEDLKNRGFLYKSDVIEHDYPFCWRCSTPLIYFARLTWFIEMSKLKNELLEANQKINWIPGHIKDGRFGDWLKEAKDWSISRERYWGTPLPIWECVNEEHRLVIGSFEELDKNSISQNRFFLVRHGEADHNLNGKIASGEERGANISKLTQAGIEQANKAAEILKKHKIEAVFHSPYERTKHTASIIAKAVKAKMVSDKRIVEINTGVFNWSSAHKYNSSFSDFKERFVKTPAGGENFSDLRSRMVDFIKDINSQYKNKNIAIVSHGDPLWILETSLKGLNELETEKFHYPELGEVREIKFPNMPFDNEGKLDVHRPFIDSIKLKCPTCEKPMQRIKEVADVWFDSGAMPFAEWHYPFQNKQLIDKKEHFPADYICEAMDQTRGWFYTLLAIATLLKREPPYKNVISTGLILDKFGQKMSKSKGNVVDPWVLIQKYGVDVVRWYLYTINDPGEPKKFNEADLAKVARKFHLLFYNSFVFLETYAKNIGTLKKFQPKNLKNTLDIWIISRLGETVLSTTKYLEAYEIGQAARKLEALIDDLSHWYIRRSRKRFSEPQSATDFNDAVGTLNFVLLELSKLTAPFCPFLAEAVYLSLPKNNQKLSVHLEDWPEIDKSLIDKSLSEMMRVFRKLSSDALALRAEAGIKVRQPLAALKIKNQKSKFKSNKNLIDILKDEINVKEISFDSKIKNALELDLNITPELYKEGILRELIRTIQKARQDAGYSVNDYIYLEIDAPKEIEEVIREKEGSFKKSIKAKRIQTNKASEQVAGKMDLKLESQINGIPIKLAIKKL